MLKYADTLVDGVRLASGHVHSAHSFTCQHETIYNEKRIQLISLGLRSPNIPFYFIKNHSTICFNARN